MVESRESEAESVTYREQDALDARPPEHQPEAVREVAEDGEWVRRMARGDAAAFERLYDRHASAVYPLVLRIVGRSADADEVLQEAWLQAWRRAATYDPTRGTVLAWLLNMARSRALDRYRALSSRHRAETQAEAEPRTAPPADPVHEALGAERSRLVRAALAGLKPRHREVLEIAYFEGLSQTEIAARLAVPVGTVKTWMRQGTLALRAILADAADPL